MEKSISPTAGKLFSSHSLKCILNCKDNKPLHRFPRDEDGIQTWLEAIGMKKLPSYWSKARICSNHFSHKMFAVENRLTRCAIPDTNIPIEVIGETGNGGLTIVKPRPFIQTPKKHRPSSTLKIGLPKGFNNEMHIEEIPHVVDVEKPVIVTSKKSRCILKCKDTVITFSVPRDKISRNIWKEKLGLPTLRSRSRLCLNHFSEKMMALAKHETKRLTSCAIPDMNLPGDVEFHAEDEADTDLDERIEIDGILEHIDNSASTAAVDGPENDFPAFQPEILINPIENLKNAVSSTTSKEGILHVFQPGIAKKPGEVESHVVVPEHSSNAENECVLKCPEGERLFRFPNLEKTRQLWLSKIGLTHVFCNSRICARHFSKEMYSSTGQRLSKSAVPDMNLPKPEIPRIKDASRVLSSYRLMNEQQHICDVTELPETICVLTIFKKHTEVDAVINGIKYREHLIDESIPRRERAVQVIVKDLVRTANIAVSTEDYVEDYRESDFVEFKDPSWLEMFKSKVFAVKAGMYECLICGEASVSHDSNVNHLQTHREPSLLCFYCGRLFASENKLRKHEIGKHRREVRKGMRCPKMHCKKVFYTKKQLNRHIADHPKRAKYKCNRCLRPFDSSLKLHSHCAGCRFFRTKRSIKKKLVS